MHLCSQVENQKLGVSRIELQLTQFIDTGQKTYNLLLKNNHLKQDTVKKLLCKNCASIGILWWIWYFFKLYLYTDHSALHVNSQPLIGRRSLLVDNHTWNIHQKHQMSGRKSVSNWRQKFFLGITYTAVFLWRNVATNIWDWFVYSITMKLIYIFI